MTSCQNENFSPQKKLAIRLLVLTGVLALGGCSTVGYYSQAVTGHLKLMSARQSIQKLLVADDTDPELRAKLQTLVDARQYAVSALGLPDNDSYNTYVETGKRAITWNVVATEEFSLIPNTWCFPVAGCVNYRGYFDRLDAEEFASSLAEKSHDITIGGASAYSTLGWFDDPVFDTMLRGDDLRYVGTLFHELAHQVLYVKDDSNFNEAFASFVEQIGVRRWLEDQQQAGRIEGYDASLGRAGEFVELLKQTRETLLELYKQPLSDTEKRERKQLVFDEMREKYEALKASWGDYKGYDGWFGRELNNARLIAVATYRRYVPAFHVIYNEVDGNLQRFYTLAEQISALPAEKRQATMAKYLETAAANK
jgi:predicted aminopeptidase